MSILSFGAITASGDSAVPASLEVFPENPISPQRAIELAKDHLDQTWELRLGMSVQRLDPSQKEPSVSVTLKGNDYYLVKDNYVTKNAEFYLRHAVRVNKDTGEITSPR